NRFGSDKPDTRFGMELCDLSALFTDSGFNAFKGKGIVGLVVPGQGEMGRNQLDGLVDRAKSLGAAGLVWMRVRDAGVPEPLAVRSLAYDLVLNGIELGSGSVRIHDAALQSKVFTLLGIEPDIAAERFGFLLDAFRYGAPPHAGFAVGLDRLTMILAGESSIRDVIAFPKTQSGTDPL